MNLSSQVFIDMNKGFTKAMERGQVLMKLFTYADRLIYDVAKFCSDGRRAKKNKIAYVRNRLKEYRDYIKNSKVVQWKRFKSLTKGDRN